MKFCLIGYPLGHSMSPFIHMQLARLSGADLSYENIEIAPADLTSLDLFHAYDGLNVTIPHKTAVIPFLKELHGKAKILKTVNTIKKENDAWIGYNTDCDGFLHALKIADIALAGRVLLCGSGGTARMMGYLAAGNSCDITISVRAGSTARGEKLKSEINAVYPKVKIRVREREQIDSNETFDLLLNGTPAGMYPKNMEQTPVPANIIQNCSAVFDAVYNPMETLLLKTAKQNGAKTAMGMPMLVYQAAKAQQIWYGATFGAKELDDLVIQTNEELQRRFS